MVEHNRIGIVFLDSFAALFLVFTATCFYWRGSWDTIDAYVLPGNEPLNHWVRFAIGTCTSLTYFSLPFIKPLLDGRSQVTFIIGSRIFMIIHGTLYMFIWRGLWGVADYYIGPAPEWGWVGLVICYTLLFILGTSRQLMWPPYMVPNDDRPDLLIAANRFGIEVGASGLTTNGRNLKSVCVWLICLNFGHNPIIFLVAVCLCQVCMKASPWMAHAVPMWNEQCNRHVCFKYKNNIPFVTSRVCGTGNVFIVSVCLSERACLFGL